MPRKRRGRYHTGTHQSPKCATPINYRSGWEQIVCFFLDSDRDVVTYGYECVQIPYVSNLRSGKTRTYFPDFLVTYRDGSQKLIEVKRVDKLADPLVVKKAKAAEAWCAKQKGIRYEIWTNSIIEGFRKVLMATKPLLFVTPAPSKRRRRRKRSSKK